jgi:hypothetical protein
MEGLGEHWGEGLALKECGRKIFMIILLSQINH